MKTALLAIAGIVGWVLLAAEVISPALASIVGISACLWSLGRVTAKVGAGATRAVESLERIAEYSRRLPFVLDIETRPVRPVYGELDGETYEQFERRSAEYEDVRDAWVLSETRRMLRQELAFKGRS